MVKNLYRNIAANACFFPSILTTAWEPPANHSVPEFQTASLPLLSPFEGGWKTRVAFVIYLPVTLWRLWQRIRAMQVDTINAHYPGLECIHFFLLRWLGVFPGKIILSFHGRDITEASKGGRIQRYLWQVLVRSADANVCCSNALAERLVAFVAEARNNVCTIWNGIDEAHFFSESLSAESKALMPKGPYLLNIATFEHKKGQDVLVDAFDRIRNRYPDLLLVIAGRRSDMSGPVRKQVAAKGLTSRVVLLEDLPHSEIPGLLSGCKLFVLPSRAEGFPVVLLEAGICAKPVVATNVDGIPELLTDEVNGRLVPSDNPECLAKAILELLDDRRKGEELGQRLHDHVVQQFSWRRAAEEYLRLLQH